MKKRGQEELLLTSVLIVFSESRRIRRCCFLRCLAKIPNPPTDTPLLARSNCLKDKQAVSAMKIKIIYQKDRLSIKSINDSPKLHVCLFQSHDCQQTFFLDHKLMTQCAMTPASPSLFAVPERCQPK